MKALIVSTLVFGSAFAPSSVLADCPSSYSSCNYYQCAEAHNPCGSQGYWIGWGYRFCQKFLNSEQKFSLEAQEWLRSNRRCLQVRAEEISTEIACPQVRKAAMESHVSCYVEAGFCELSIKDKSAILWDLRSALAAPEAWIEGLRLQAACRKAF